MPKIFKDISKLYPTYIPKEIPHREKEIKDLINFYSDFLEKPYEYYPINYKIIGPVGCGKTVVTMKFGEIFKNEANKRKINFDYIYLNPREHGASRLILFREIVKKLNSRILSLNKTPEELLSTIADYLKYKNKFIIIIFDEIDYFLKQSKESIVYNLTRFHEISPQEKCRVIGTIFTSRSKDFFKYLEPDEISSLGRFFVEFKPYSSNQIYDILEKRVYEAFYPNSINDDALRLISDVASSPPSNGNVRYALDILLYSGIIAENKGDSKIEVEHVRNAIQILSPSITEEDIMYLENEEKFILLTIARELKNKKETYISFDEIVEGYNDIKKEYKIRELSLRNIVKIVQNLENKGIIDIKGLTEIGISKVPVENLDKFLDNLIQRILKSEKIEYKNKNVKILM